MKRIITIQDISCVGKCSLTVALPVISACGIETCVLPTAVLSTHTAFTNFTFRDLTDQISPAAECFKKENIGFDAIYTGYLGTIEQIDLMDSFFNDFKTEDNIIFVDPVMADNGKLYKGFNGAYAKKNAELCGRADIIVPNLTEACFLLGRPYLGDDYCEGDIKILLTELCRLGAKNAVITGVSFNDGELGVMSFNAKTQKFFSYFTERIPFSFHGTGDVFSSAAVGALVSGHSLESSLRIAADFTVRTIRATVADPGHSWYGVEFETQLGYLTEMIKENG